MALINKKPENDKKKLEKKKKKLQPRNDNKDDINGIDDINDIDDMEELISLPDENNNSDMIYGNLELVCEWKNCFQKMNNDIDLFQDHIQRHYDNLKLLKDNYMCLWFQCTFVTNCKEHFMRHLSYHQYHTILKLKGRIFASEINIPICSKDNSNVNIIPDELISTKFFCHYDQCEEQFQSIILFINHVKLHCQFTFKTAKNPYKDEIILKCGWDNCDKKFFRVYRLTEHVKTHTKEKLISCFQCGKFFATRSKFSDHCKSQEPDKNLHYQCNYCYKYFANKRLLRCHYNVHYNFFKCSMCDMTCPTKHSLIIHIRHRHWDSRPYECNQCTKKFNIANDLKRHISHVHENISYECTELGCNYIIKNKLKLKKHIAEAHTNNKIIYACHECDKVYSRGDTLSRHLKQKHKFQLPSGHKRFTYRQDANGIYRFQATRIETLEVLSKPMSPKPISEYVISEISENNIQNDFVIRVEVGGNPIQKFNFKCT